MGQAKQAAFRLQVVQERQSEGLSYSALCKRHGVSYNTVRSICTSYELKGESSLLPDYSACGRPRVLDSEKGYRLVRLLKYLHPGWGVPYITTRIKEQFPQLALSSDRQCQRRLRSDVADVAVPPPKLPKQPSPERPRLANDEWQVDANERIGLADGSESCYLNVTDAKSNALLKAKAFPPRAHLRGGYPAGKAGHAWPVPGMGDAQSPQE
jgi:transposase